MRRLHTRFRYLIAIGLVLSLAGFLTAQNAPHKALVVNGKTVDGAIIEMDGRSYVDVEALGKAIGGVVTIEASRVVLNTSSAAPPAGEEGAPPAAAPSTATAVPALLPDQMSRDFMRLAVGELAEMREWRGAVGAVVTFGIPVTGSWPQDYQDRVQSGLAQVALAASNGADRDALQLLQNEYASLQGWADDVISARQALNAARSIDPNALQNDKVLAKISNCGEFLNSMIVSGTYADNSNCH